jgi:hypothetical protein
MGHVFHQFKLRWQEGYGVLTLRKDEVEKVSRYIDNQEQHHVQAIFQSCWKASKSRRMTRRRFWLKPEQSPLKRAKGILNSSSQPTGVNAWAK